MTSESYLKWAGGKSQLCPELHRRLPTSWSKWVEPFVGSGSFYFFTYSNLKSHEMFETINLPPAVLSDINRLLINCHNMVAQHLKEIIPLFHKYEARYAKHPDLYYTSQADRVQIMLYNWNSIIEHSLLIDAAALFIFLNRAAFNGLWRLSSKFNYNVPSAKRKTIKMFNKRMNRCSELLKHATINDNVFESTVAQNLGEDVFFYFDPPYHPISSTSNFVGYTELGWTEDDTNKLATNLDEIDKTGGKFMVSNSDSPAVLEIFKKWKIEKVPVKRFIKAKGKRIRVIETIIRNY